MATINYRNKNVKTLTAIAGELADAGFEVGPVVIPENTWTHGHPYITTGAGMPDILKAIRNVRRDDMIASRA